MTQKEFENKMKNEAYKFGYTYATEMMRSFLSGTEVLESNHNYYVNESIRTGRSFKEELEKLKTDMEQLKESWIADDCAMYTLMRKSVVCYPYSDDDDEFVQDGLYDAMWSNIITKVKYQNIPKQLDGMIETINTVLASN